MLEEVTCFPIQFLREAEEVVPCAAFDTAMGGIAVETVVKPSSGLGNARL